MFVAHEMYAHMLWCLCLINAPTTSTGNQIKNSPQYYLQKCGAIRLLQGFDAELDQSGGLLQFSRAARLLFLERKRNTHTENRSISGRVHRLKCVHTYF